MNSKVVGVEVVDDERDGTRPGETATSGETQMRLISVSITCQISRHLPISATHQCYQRL